MEINFVIFGGNHEFFSRNDIIHICCSEYIVGRKNPFLAVFDRLAPNG